jgi:hypothetical protein
MKLFISLLLLTATTCSGADHVWLTIYDQNYAVVRDVRSFALPEGTSEIRFGDLSPMILDAPVRLSGDGIVALEQTFLYHRLSNDLLLNDCLDKKIELLMRDTVNTSITGKLIGLPRSGSADEKYLLQQADGSVRTVRFGDVKDFRYPALPQEYQIEPALTFTVKSSAAGVRDVEAAYEVQGLDWDARYLLDLSDNDSAAVFSGWAVVRNAAGRAFNHARLTLVAGMPPNVQKHLRLTTDARKKEGTVEVVANERRFGAETVVLSEMAADFAPGLVHEQLFELQTYTLPDETSLPDGAEKELNLFPPATIKTSASYEYAWWQDINGVGVYVETVNTDSVGLGVPLPAGPVEIYRMRAGNVPEYVGENRIAATAVNEPARIRVGSAEGLTVNRNLLKTETHSSGKKDETWEVRLKNARDTEVSVKIQDVFQTKWKILSSSHPYNEITKNMIEFPVTVPSDSELVVTYEVRTWKSWEGRR